MTRVKRTEKNCIDLFTRAVDAVPKRTALWFGPDEALTFTELEALSRNVQEVFRARGLRTGDSVLLALGPSPELYAACLGLLGMGATLLLVEPWMPTERVNHVIDLVKPRAFLAGWLGKLWGWRTPGIRAIPEWVTAGQIRKHGPLSNKERMIVEPRDPLSRAVVTFSSGTTGQPKGVIRTDEYMTEMHYLLTDEETRDLFDGPDLSVFVNVGLFRLGTGRGVIDIRPGWKTRDLEAVAVLPDELSPETLTCGPAFLARLIETKKTRGGLMKLKNIYLGGALTDCSVLEEGLKLWPEASWAHVYGGSDAEPVAMADGRKALELSRARGYTQLLHIGSPVKFVQTRFEGERLLVSGPNVCSEFVDRPEKPGPAGPAWHDMGDRIERDSDGWWYYGRCSQPREQFFLEQEAYSLMNHSRALFYRASSGEGVLLGEGVKTFEKALKKRLPQIDRVREGKIVRDRRHRARIDRDRTLRKARLT